MPSEGFAGRWWWGSGASAVQVEGASPADDWSRWTSAGNAPPSYDGNGFARRYREDFALLRELGLTDHRLSINWARVEPVEGRLDQDAVDYYRAVLSAARDAGLRMWVCLLHSAIPVWFADVGGFAGDRASAAWLRWVDLAAALFGDLVGGWMPVNLPTSYAQKAYLTGTFPPGRRDPEQFAAVLATVHAGDFEAALRLREATGKPTCSNEAVLPLYPADDRPETATAVALLDEVVWDSWLNLAREPRYADAFDLIGFSYYYAMSVTSTGAPAPFPAGGRPGPLGYVPWPDGIAVVLDRLHRELPGARIVVAEVGYGDTGGLDDTARCEYLHRAFEHIAAAQDDGMRIEGVSIWTGIDNYEWLAGRSVSFGLFDADRRPRRSASLIRSLTGGR
ncbi:family 1 glycosylhydrolase [Kutzneria kofuensis]|uniref:Beta-glucosidase n=1 Tax=Kutzneria kofuensis TaxID=103725 RepID=A0A7W9KQI9_9PSEU|nr:family 1 glycosylhydrolase [Kutzneria kofuensis]MBB5896881.1 beta-glucosidase [Kutzneria kofuensis]